ncbi:MAG TPA: hypothetical protein VD907_00925 [Verrucomicrobiae bacterium]|nr:hypothetical protein [Verrucomicrobiae bacterium]
MLVAFFLWWYTEGWKQQLKKAVLRLAGIADLFSIDLLLKTLFAPFRQISAGRVNGSLNMQFRAFIDRLFSRVIGAIMRLFMIIIGAFALLLAVVVNVALLMIWPLLPLLPVVGVVLFIQGWLPWR